MQIVTSAQNPVVKLIRSLAQKKHRREAGLFVAEGPDVLARARAEGWEPDYIVSTGEEQPWGKSQLIRVSDAVLAGMSGQNNPSGILGVFRQRFGEAPKQPSPKDIWLALEAIRDPGNLGTIIRTADAVSGNGIILVGECCDPFGPETVRATTGSIFAMPLVRMEPSEFLAVCRSWPGETVATAAGGEQSFRRSYRRPVMLVMGSEGSGLSPEVAAACNVSVHIPMPGRAESLNVAVATGIMLYEIIR